MKLERAAGGEGTVEMMMGAGPAARLRMEVERLAREGALPAKHLLDSTGRKM